MLKDWGERKVHYSVSVKKGKEGKRNNLIVEFFLLLFVRVRSFCEGFKNVIFHRCWSAAEQGGVVKNGNLCQVFWSDGSNWVKNRNSVARIVCVCTCVRRELCGGHNGLHVVVAELIVSRESPQSGAVGEGKVGGKVVVVPPLEIPQFPFSFWG